MNTDSTSVKGIPDSFLRMAVNLANRTSKPSFNALSVGTDSVCDKEGLSVRVTDETVALSQASYAKRMKFDKPLLV
jgi:hypothetical protein